MGCQFYITEDYKEASEEVQDKYMHGPKGAAFQDSDKPHPKADPFKAPLKSDMDMDKSGTRKAAALKHDPRAAQGDSSSGAGASGSGATTPPRNASGSFIVAAPQQSYTAPSSPRIGTQVAESPAAPHRLRPAPGPSNLRAGGAFSAPGIVDQQHQVQHQQHHHAPPALPQPAYQV
jgi:hypothetical protein